MVRTRYVQASTINAKSQMSFGPYHHDKKWKKCAGGAFWNLKRRKSFLTDFQIENFIFQIVFLGLLF